MATLEHQALANGWRTVDIGFLVHDDTDDDIFLDFNGGDGSCYYVMKMGCSEVWDVLFSYADLEAKYLS
jgi:hypothetical protein